MLLRGAVVIDTETTDLGGAICELAVVDARTGIVLLESLVAAGQPIHPAAAAVHGIVDGDLDGAPTLPELLPRLRRAIGRRPLLAYNAPYDYDALRQDAQRDRLDLGRLGAARSWSCIMRARAEASGGSWLALDGGHRAAGDAIAAARVLHDLAARPGHSPALQAAGVDSRRH